MIKFNGYVPMYNICMYINRKYRYSNLILELTKLDNLMFIYSFPSKFHVITFW